MQFITTVPQVIPNEHDVLTPKLPFLFTTHVHEQKVKPNYLIFN